MGRDINIIKEGIRRSRFDNALDSWRRFKANKAAYVSLYILVILFLVALFAPYITPYNPYEFDLRKAFTPPSIEHPFGMDEMGRDILSRVIEGSRYSIGIAIASVMLGASIGLILGLISGYYGRWIDHIIQRFTDALLSFPTLLLAIALIAVLGVGVTNLIISVGVSTVPIYIRLVRGLVIQERSRDYITAVKLIGKGDGYIIFKHILPNIISPVIIQSTYYLGLTILIASGMGFLGLGVQPPIPEWGSMIGSGRTYIFSSPHVVLYPGLFILVTALAFNLLGDGLRDALDPRMRYIGG